MILITRAHRQQAGWHRQRGAIATMVALMLIIMLGMAGVAVDAGRLFIVRSELQAAADSCSLAAASALTGANTSQLEVAENAGIAAGTINRIDGQRLGATIRLNTDVTFADTLTGPFSPRAGAGDGRTRKYVRCALNVANLPTILVQVVNMLPGADIGAQSMRASSIATIVPSQSSCAVPMGVCSYGGGVNFGITPGRWLFNKPSNADTNFAASNETQPLFKWLNYPVAGGGFPAGAAASAAFNAALAGPGACGVTNATQVTNYTTSTVTAGTPTGDAFNSRFGLYRAGSAYTAVTAPPDFSTFVYAPPPNSGGNVPPAVTVAQVPNVESILNRDFRAKRGNFTGGATNPNGSVGNWAGTALQTPTPAGYAWQPTAQLRQNATDRRLVTAPVVDCGTLAGGGATPILGWACLVLLNPVGIRTNDAQQWIGAEYVGRASNPATGCVTIGAPGDPAATGPVVPAIAQ